MSSREDRILALLAESPQGLDDDELAELLGQERGEPVRRQAVNQCCNRLAAQGLLERRRTGLKNKIHNFAGRAGIRPIAASTTAPKTIAGYPWYWEGHVQTALVKHLRSAGYSIVRTSDTASHQQGKDVEALGNGRRLWATVKGYPEGTERTAATTQASHYFKDAVFDLIVWHGEDANAALVLGLPDFPRYRNLARRIEWLHRTLTFQYGWVHEDGSVEIE